MTKNDKILLVCSFIVGCVVTFFVAGCARPTPVTYSVTEKDNNTENEMTILYSVEINDTVITEVTCKGCHFVCNHCVKEE